MESVVFLINSRFVDSDFYLLIDIVPFVVRLSNVPYFIENCAAIANCN